MTWDGLRAVESVARYLQVALVTALLFQFAMRPASGQITVPHEDEAIEHARRGISLAKEGNFPQAQQELEQAVRMGPEVAQYRAQLASILGLQGKWQPALEAFQKAIDLAPDDLNFRREAAAVQWQLGLMPAAEQNLQFVLTRQPQDPGSILLLGLVKEKTGDYRKAAELLDSQFALVSSQPDRVVALFHAVMESGQSATIPKIVDVLTQHAKDQQWTGALSRSTQYAAAHGELQVAEPLFALIPHNDPAYAPAALHIAKLYYDHARVPDARQLLLQLEANGVVSADLQALLGNCYESDRQPALALQAYHRAIEADPKRVDYYEDLISLLLYLHKTDDALAQSWHAIEAAPHDARPWVWKGNVELRRNSPKDAMESYTKALQLDSLNSDALLGVATVYFATGRSDEAIAEYRVGISRFPNDARFYVACAEILWSSPDSAKVQSETASLLTTAVRLSPKSSEAHYLLGQLAMQKGRWNEAEAELLLSLESDPDRSKTHFALSRVYRRLARAEDASKEFARYEDLKKTEEGAAMFGLKPAEPR